MGQALYRRYRPKNLDEVVGQDHITKSLKNAIKNGKISHAYLFTGPRGVGKTSVARILAHEVNNFAYEDNNTQLDIIEIDAASNRRIDEIRDLRDKVHIAPSNGKYKVYIIDEVHMLTKEAFNALLKTLEEPPAHVIFILATTESHKLPATIISRTQRFSFRPIDSHKALDHLKQVAIQENIKVDEAALAMIVEHGEGSFRDSLSLLDQAGAGHNEINVETVKILLGIAPKEAIDKIIKAMVEGDPKSLLDVLSQLEEGGYQASLVAKQLAENLRNQLVDQNNRLDPSTSLKILKQLLDVPTSTSPEKLLEVILLDIAFSNASKADLKTSKPAPALAEDHTEVIDNQIKEIPTTASQTFSLEQWPVILDSIKSRHNTLYGILRMSQPSFKDGILTLSFKFSFHQKRIGEPKMQQIINETFIKLGLQPIKIIAVVVSQNEKATTKASNQVDVATISNIFGEAEVLES